VVTNRGTFPGGAARFAAPRTSTPSRIVMGSRGFWVIYPTLGTSYWNGFDNFGYSQSYPPYGYGGYGYGGYGYGGYDSGSSGVIAAGGGPSIILNLNTNPQPIPAANDAGPMAPAAAPGSASVTVIVPEGGQVWFDNTLTQKSGTKWVYSAAVEPGKTVTLGVKARWTENGQDRDLDTPVKLRSGDAFTIDVTKIR
jgi:hypothetical protein